jgi:very-short-patch-repair endonuclease
MPRHILTPEERRRGGLTRAAQPSFIDLQRERGRRGAAALLRKPGGYALLQDKLAAYHQAHPTAPERFVREVLLALGLEEGRDFACQQRISVAEHELRLDFVVQERLVLEPGHRRWHGRPADTLDGQDHTILDAARDQLLTERLGLVVLRLDADEIAHQPEQVRARIAAALRGPRQRAA